MNARYFATAVIALLGAVTAGSRAEEAGPRSPADALVQRVSAAYAEEMRGVVALRTRTELRIDGPMYHRQTPSAPWYVYSDGALVSSSEQPDARRPLVHDALRPTYLPEYHFAFTDCADCPAGNVAIAYDSSEHDDYHAHGYFVIDTASDRVLRSVEIPYALPWPTHDGRLEVTWGTAGSQWLPVSVSGTFSGKLGPFSGVAHYTQQLSPYERYPHVETAVAALTAQTGATPAPQFPTSPN